MCQRQGLRGKNTCPFERTMWMTQQPTSSAQQLHSSRFSSRVRTSGAGPRTTLPWLLYCEPWHGHMNLFSACRAAPGLSNPIC